MINHRAGESILSIRINIHLHDTILESLVYFLKLGTGTTMKNKIKRSTFSKCFDNCGLASLQNCRRQFNIAGFIDSMNISESCRQQETSHRTDFPGSHHHIFRSGVEFVGGDAGCIVAILFTTYNACFHFQNKLVFNTKLHEAL